MYFHIIKKKEIGHVTSTNDNNEIVDLFIPDIGYIEKCKELISKGHIEAVISFLKDRLQSKSSQCDIYNKYYRELLMISNRYRRVNFNKRHDFWSNNEITIEQNKICFALVEMISDLENCQKIK